MHACMYKLYGMMLPISKALQLHLHCLLWHMPVFISSVAQTAKWSCYKDSLYS
jgi:hypothetical protein